MKKERRAAALCCALMLSAAIAGCGSSTEPLTDTKPQTTAETVEQTQETAPETVPETTAGSSEAASAETDASTAAETAAEEKQPVTLNYRFADAEEAEQRLLAQTDYLEALTQNDLDYRVGKSGATLDEFKEVIHEGMLSFTDEEKEEITKCMDKFSERLNEMGFVYDCPEEVTFIKTTMHEEGDAGGYTHGTEVYISQKYFDYLREYPEETAEAFYLLMVHEFFHCMTRTNDDFRRDMYAVISTEIDSSIEIKPEMRANILSNPDVERYDNYAVFDIEGTPTKCMVVTYVEDYAEGAGSFFDHIKPALLPVETQDRFIMAEDVPDFYKVLGENTGYVIAAEECMADNFSYAVVYGIGGCENCGYATPRIIDDIIDRCAGR